MNTIKSATDNQEQSKVIQYPQNTDAGSDPVHRIKVICGHCGNEILVGLAKITSSDEN